MNQNISWEELYQRAILSLKLCWYSTYRYNVECLVRSLDEVENENSKD